MNKLIPIGLAILWVGATPAIASSSFDGTWKGDIKASQVSTKPTVYLLNATTFTCSTCVPTISVATDGAYHPVVGSPYYDEMAVTVVDPMTVKRSTRKRGKVMGEATTVIAADGKTSTTSFTDMTAPNGIPVTGQGMDQRIGFGPKGAHMLSGSWRQTNTAAVSDSGLVYTMTMDGDLMRYSTPTGIAYAAKIDGTPAPVTGDPGWTQVSLKRTGPDTLVETDMRDGKVISKTIMTVSDMTMTMRVTDLLRKRDATYVAHRQ